ncbi:MAG: FAD:protein FMN transferase [Chloroflexi bacterium]|nr:FAD:protein FMN transferase [Chloroflexota bacterium]
MGISLARRAMGTRFELVLEGEGDPVRLRAAGEEALDEIERLERQLSLYQSESDLSGLNRDAGARWVRIDPRFFKLLERAVSLSMAADGAFDITVAPLMHAWGFVGARGRMPDAAAVRSARELVGCHHLLLDAASSSVRFDSEGVSIDLGAIGKGYAVERALDILREGGVQAALIHGGASTIGVLGRPPGAESWRIAIADPFDREQVVTHVRLKDGDALSVSAQHEKCFTGPDGRTYGHVLDPRSGVPVQGARLAAVVGASATDTDALSTALLVLGSPPRRQSAGPPAATEEPDVWQSVSTLVVNSSGDVAARGCAFEDVVRRAP